MSAGSGVLRAAAAAVLLALAAVGLRARASLPSIPNGPLASASGHVTTAGQAVIDGAVIAGCAALLISLFRRPRRRKRSGEDSYVEDRPPAPWWAKWLGIALGLAIIAVPLIVLATAPPRSAATRDTASPAPAPPRGGSHASPGPGGVWPEVAGIVLAAAVLVALGLLARARSRAAPEPPGEPGDAAALAAGVLAASTALRGTGDPRQAVIDSYGAMERGFASAGVPPAAADTPGEVLDRAAGGGLVRSSAAGDLTRIFRLARYSRRPVTGADRDLAADALARLRSDLGAPEA